MLDQQDMNQAKEVYATLCRSLDARNWNYDKDEEGMHVTTGAKGDDLPIELFFTVDAERKLIVLTSRQPYVIPENKRLDVAIGVSAVNNMLAHGCFDFKLATGELFYRMTNSFLDSQIGEELFHYLIGATGHVVDEYNDKFLMLGKGMLSMEQFLASLRS